MHTEKKQKTKKSKKGRRVLNEDHSATPWGNDLSEAEEENWGAKHHA